MELSERRLSWTELMHRVSAVGVLECLRCGIRRKLTAVITVPAVIAAILESLALPTGGHPLAPAPQDDALHWQAGESDPVLC